MSIVVTELLKKSKIKHCYKITHNDCCSFVCDFNDFQIINYKGFPAKPSHANITCPCCDQNLTFNCKKEDNDQIAVGDYNRMSIKEITEKDYNKIIQKDFERRKVAARY